MLEDIIVTATKREQSLQEVPSSIAVFSEERLQKLNAVNFVDFADSVPGLTFAATGVGNSYYFIRGVDQAGPGQSPSTAIYYDETPLQTHTLTVSKQPDPILVYVARVEVNRPGYSGDSFV